MTSLHDNAVGLRELRHQTSEVLARVRHGETIDVTEYGRLIARIIPVPGRARTSIMEQLIASGQAQAAVRPGYRPAMRPSVGSDKLGEALAELRDEESW